MAPGSTIADAALKRRERLAWRVVLTGFALFCALLVAVPLGLRQYLLTATAVVPARLEIIRGTVLYLQAGSRQEVSAANQLELGEGDQVRAAADAQALLWLADGSNLRLWPETTLRLERIRASRYNDSTTETILALRAGRVRVEVAPPTTAARRFELRAGRSSARLREGSYGVQVAEGTLEVSVRLGSASVSGGERSVEVLAGERTAVALGQSPEPPRPAARNYVANGDFAGGLQGWRSGARNVEDGILGEVGLVEQDGRSIVRFARRGSSKHAETYIHQGLERDVSDLQSLKLSLQLKLLGQSLDGGGWLGSEYPLLIRLRYRDAGGGETAWVHGFYFRNDEGRPTTSGQRVERGEWVSFVADLFDPEQVQPRPAYLLWLELEASGWEYESLATGVQVVGE